MRESKRQKRSSDSSRTPTPEDVKEFPVENKIETSVSAGFTVLTKSEELEDMEKLDQSKVPNYPTSTSPTSVGLIKPVAKVEPLDIKEPLPSTSSTHQTGYEQISEMQENEINRVEQEGTEASNSNTLKIEEPNTEDDEESLLTEKEEIIMLKGSNDTMEMKIVRNIKRSFGLTCARTDLIYMESEEHRRMREERRRRKKEETDKEQKAKHNRDSKEQQPEEKEEPSRKESTSKQPIMNIHQQQQQSQLQMQMQMKQMSGGFPPNHLQQTPANKRKVRYYLYTLHVYFFVNFL